MTVSVVAYFPDAVNSVVLNPETILAPKRWGPVIDGREVFTDAVTMAYAEAGMEVRFLDGWRTHHLFAGDVHCGTLRWTELGRAAARMEIAT